MRIINVSKGKILAERVEIADSFFSRIKGLLGKECISDSEALVLRPCVAIHTLGMKFPIDVIFLGKDNTVVAIRKGLLPNRLAGFYFGAFSAVELPAGTLEKTGTTIGDRIEIV